MNWFKMFLVTLVLAAVGFTAVLATDFNDSSAPIVSASCSQGPSIAGRVFAESCMNLPGMDAETCMLQCIDFCNGLYGPEGVCLYDETYYGFCAIGCWDGTQ